MAADDGQAELTVTEPPLFIASNVTERIRRGIIFPPDSRWPFRLDIAVEYQDWILVGMCFGILAVWCMPCFCGTLKNKASVGFTRWVYIRLNCFYCVLVYLTLFTIMMTIGVLPDWTVNEFFKYVLMFLVWMLVHVKKLITSASIIICFLLLFRFKERIAMAAGMEHVSVLRFSWRDLLPSFASKVRPVEVYIWKVDDLQSSVGKAYKANDIFVECHLGFNEPMRTRVHNNAGSSCLIRESFQMNIDEASSGSLLTLMVKDQSLMSSTEIGRLIITTREVCGVEDATGKKRVDFMYSEESFVSMNLMPRGKIWIAIAPVEDADEEKAPLMQEDALVTC